MWFFRNSFSDAIIIIIMFSNITNTTADITTMIATVELNTQQELPINETRIDCVRRILGIIRKLCYTVTACPLVNLSPDISSKRRLIVSNPDCPISSSLMAICPTRCLNSSYLVLTFVEHLIHW